jgi:hypothetical protein
LNFGQTIWDRIVVVLGTTWGTPCEHDENTLRTRPKKNKNCSLTHPTPQRKKLDPSGVHTEPSHWLHETFISTHSKKKEVGEGNFFLKNRPSERKVERGKKI